MNVKDFASYKGENMSLQQTCLYQQKVGSILYATVIMRPDVAKTASKLSEFLQNLSPCHHAATDQVISYLYNMKGLAIEFLVDTDKANIFACSSDAAFADDKETRHSSEGYLFKLFGSAIEWHSTKQ